MNNKDLRKKIEYFITKIENKIEEADKLQNIQSYAFYSGQVTAYRNILRDLD